MGKGEKKMEAAKKMQIEITEQEAKGILMAVEHLADSFRECEDEAGQKILDGIYRKVINASR